MAGLGKRFLRSRQPASVLKVPPKHAEGRRVLILSASAGTGHVRAAEALEKVFRQQPGVGEVRNIDALRFTNRLFRDFYSKLYIQLVQKAPTILGIVYNTMDEPWKTDRMRLMLDRLNTGPLERFIQRFKPDITVCTHYLPAEIGLSYLINKGTARRALFSIVVTDFDVHAMWLCKTFHRYFVALEESKIHLQVLGLPADNITVSGIPIDPAFLCRGKSSRTAPASRARSERSALPHLRRRDRCQSRGRRAARASRGSSNPHRPSSSAARTPRCRPTWSKKPRRSRRPNPGLSFRVLGYTNEMHRWMQMSDLFIGKPGGLTTAECLASGLPMIIVAPIPGQEDRNSDHLLEKGIAIKCNEFTTLAYKIDGLFSEPDRLRHHAQERARLRPPARRQHHRRFAPASARKRSRQGRPLRCRSRRNALSLGRGFHGQTPLATTASPADSGAKGNAVLPDRSTVLGVALLIAAAVWSYWPSRRKVADGLGRQLHGRQQPEPSRPRWPLAHMGRVARSGLLADELHSFGWNGICSGCSRSAITYAIWPSHVYGSALIWRVLAQLGLRWGWLGGLLSWFIR